MEREVTVAWIPHGVDYSDQPWIPYSPTVSFTVFPGVWMHGASPRSAHLSRVEIVLQLCSIALG